jgi:hypothetical protein
MAESGTRWSHAASTLLRQVVVESEMLTSASSSLVVNGHHFGLVSPNENSTGLEHVWLPSSTEDDFAREISAKIDKLVSDFECLQELAGRRTHAPHVTAEVPMLRQRIDSIMTDLDRKEALGQIDPCERQQKLLREDRRLRRGSNSTPLRRGSNSAPVRLGSNSATLTWNPWTPYPNRTLK